MCVCRVLYPAWAQAKGGSIPPVNLIVPETVREVIAQYFVLPEELLKTESERAAFMRRAQREIPELLATEGYFSGKVMLRAVSSAGVLELEVMPGTRTVVTEVNIEFRGDLALPEAQRSERVQQLRAAWAIAAGQALPGQRMGSSQSRSAGAGGAQGLCRRALGGKLRPGRCWPKPAHACMS